ncbi:HD superfamily phosphodiesterase [Chryseobacterium ginsenosidimutans]|uniref:HD domain-containing protein n=1 Tax=Chryseobacterium ginsenosidimutans TaxID=687846 RepID=UPI00278B5AD3|nr:HD domain-containing protein [Chryseobacterium ginsenosidimutans]MDQ0595073.1 HD superfamily phosphodiesterase [Chryseobacterium ginsenosidimutans]
MAINGKIIGGIKIPDSAMAVHSTELLREHGSELLYNHSLRVFLFAVLNGQQNKLKYDAELLYISSMFHDLGLTSQYRSEDKRFEIDGANAARDFLRSYNVSPQSLQLVWDTIALHTSPGIAEYKEPEVALLNYGAALDVIGKGYDQLSNNIREEIIKEFPRNQLKKNIITTFFDGFKHKPHTTYGNINSDICACMIPNYQQPDYCNLILNSPWSE